MSSRRVSSLESSSVAIDRVVDSKYDNIKIVADNIDAIVASYGVLPSVEAAVLLNTAKVSNVDHPLVETAVPVGALFTDTDTIYDSTANDAAVSLNTAKISNVDHPLVEAAVPVGAVFTDTTYSSSDFAHDNTSGFVSNEHIDWTTDAGGTLIAASNLPGLALTSVFTVEDEAAQLALVADEGDVAIRTDINQSFAHNGGVSGTIADWSQLLTPTDSILSVGASGPLSSSGGANPSITIAQADTSTDGYMSQDDWNTFNDKQDGGGNKVVAGLDNWGWFHRPEGGEFAKGSAALLGHIKISLPVLWTNNTVNFWVDVYDFDTNEAVTFRLSGFNGTFNTTWSDTSAVQIGGNKEFSVYFGTDNVNSCVWIGDVTDNWKHPKIVVRDLLVGYNPVTDSVWSAGWAIDVDEVAIPTISLTHNNIKLLDKNSGGTVGGDLAVTGELEVTGSVSSTGLVITAIPLYADEAAAVAGALDSGTVYQTASGELRIKL